MKKYEHLPIFGIGPAYVVSILLPTMIGVILRNNHVFASGRIITLRIPLAIVGVVFIILAAILWIQAVIVSKLDENIKKNHLVTSGVYAWVRNPIYSAFLFLCTGVLLFCRNWFFLILPFIFWGFLTAVMKLTEEKWLKNLFGESYVAYCKRVNRFIPWKKIKNG